MARGMETQLDSLKRTEDCSSVPVVCDAPVSTGCQLLWCQFCHATIIIVLSDLAAVAVCGHDTRAFDNVSGRNVSPHLCLMHRLEGGCLNSEVSLPVSVMHRDAKCFLETLRRARRSLDVSRSTFYGQHD